MKHHTTNTAQLGFDCFLTDADEANERHHFAKGTAHLPGTWDEALPYYRNLIDLHHAAMLIADEAEVMRLKDEAHDLAAKLNGGTTFGICAPDGSGRRLEDATACTDGIPLWGQKGEFVTDIDGMTVRIEIEGLFGIGSSFNWWPSFQTHAVDRRKPFLSETGFRSFMGCGYSDLIPGLTPEQFVTHMLVDHIDTQLGGKLVKVKALTRQKTKPTG